jgi:hypothetical protein
LYSSTEKEDGFGNNEKCFAGTLLIIQGYFFKVDNLPCLSRLHIMMYCFFYLEASVDQAFVKQLSKHPPYALHKRWIHRLIVITEVNPSTKTTNNSLKSSFITCTVCIVMIRFDPNAITKLNKCNSAFDALNGTTGYQINILHLTTWQIIIWYPRVPFSASYIYYR